MTQILRKGLFFAPLGVLFALASFPLRVPVPIRRILAGLGLLFAAAVALTIEMIQVFLPSHTPDLTDVMLCAVGTLIAMFVTARILASRRGLGDP